MGFHGIPSFNLKMWFLEFKIVNGQESSLSGGKEDMERSLKIVETCQNHVETMSKYVKTMSKSYVENRSADLFVSPVGLAKAWGEMWGTPGVADPLRISTWLQVSPNSDENSDFQ